jgi:hypothetical protein
VSRFHKDFQHEPVPVRIRNKGERLTVPVHVFTSLETTSVNSLWVLGFGAGNLAVGSTLRAQRRSRLHGASVILPYHTVPVPHLEAFTNEVIPQVVEALQPSAGKVALAGESRGAGVVGRAVGQIPEKVYAAGMMEPAFINSHHLGCMPREAVSALFRRLAVDNPKRLQQPLHPGNRQTVAGMLAEMTGFVLGGRSFGALYGGMCLVVDHGVADRTIASIAAANEAGVPMRITGGIQDPLFPYLELRDALVPSGLVKLLHPIDAAHVGPGTPEGYPHVQHMTDFVSRYVPGAFCPYPAGPGPNPAT